MNPKSIWVLEDRDADKVALTSVDYIVPSIKTTYGGFLSLHVELVEEKYDLRQYRVSWMDKRQDGSPGEKQSCLSSWRLFGLYDEPTHF